MKAFKRIGFLILLALTVGFLRHNESVASQSKAGVGEELVLELPPKSGGSLGRVIHERETISIDFPDEDVRTILRNVADIYDLNVVVPDRLQGRTSIKLRNVTWRQAFEVILEPLGYTYIEDRNIIRIKSNETLVTEPLDTRVFIMNYSTAAELEPSVLPLIDTRRGGSIQVDARSNSLVITERPSRMNKIQEIIDTLDRVTDQMLIEVKLFEVIQREREQPNGDVPSTPTSVEKSHKQEPSIDAIVDSEGELYAPQAFGQILGKLEASKGVRLVSSFNVTTLDDEDATIATSEKFPVSNYVYNEESGAFEVDGVKYQDVGMTFTVRSEVNSLGFIRLSMTTEVSHFTGKVGLTRGEGGMSLPMITTRSTSSKVMVKDGYTLSVGGMSEMIHQSVVSELSDVSALAEGASNDRREVTHTKQFVMFVTAKTLNPDGANYRDSTDARVLHEMEIVESDIPGYSLPEDQSELLDEVRRLRAETDRIQAKLEYQSALSDELKEKKEMLEDVD